MIKTFLAIALFTVSMMMYVISAQAGETNNTSVEVEEIELNQSTNSEKVSELWNQARQKTGSAAKSATEFSKQQGSKAVAASKKAVSAGTEAVVDGSKKAWKTTKDVSGKVVDYSSNKANQVKDVVVDAVTSDSKNAPISERSTQSTSN